VVSPPSREVADIATSLFDLPILLEGLKLLPPPDQSSVPVGEGGHKRTVSIRADDLDAAGDHGAVPHSGRESGDQDVILQRR
jgi:hypothetical protein